MSIKDQLEISSARTYARLTGELGKGFVDQSLLSILGFDKAMDVAEYGSMRIDRRNTPAEIANILSDTGLAITFAREKVSEQGFRIFDQYFGRFLNEKTNMEDIRNLIIAMIDNMNDSMDAKTLEDVYYDFRFLFIFSGELKYRCPKIFGKAEKIGSIISLPKTSRIKDIVILPQENMGKYISNIGFREKFQNFLNKFYEKIRISSNQDKKKMYFLSEILRVQSGDKEGVGNTMNPMIQNLIMDEFFGRYSAENIDSLLGKIVFKWKQYRPGTVEYARKQIQTILDKIIYEYMFPKKYGKY